MDVERLEVVGNEVAQQVAVRTDVDDIVFVVLPGRHDGGVEVICVLVKGARKTEHTMHTEQVHKLLGAPEAQVRSFLEAYLEYAVRSFLDSENKGDA
jgi:sulfite reductase beta subunit-like hemoprotein